MASNSLLQRFLRARTLVDRAVVAKTDDRPVFIGACPRSGTTLLRTMLNAHPELAIPRETRFLMESYRERHTWGDLRIDANRRAAAEFIAQRPDSWFGRLEVDRDYAVERLLAAPPTIGSLLGTAYQLYAEANGKSRWGDKRPTFITFHREVFRMFPDAQFVYLVRDPRAAIASMKKLGWYEGNVGPAVELWLRCVEAGARAAKAYRPDQFLQLRYEDFVRDPEARLRDICSFLGSDQAHLPKMMAFHENVDEQNDQYHSRLNEPVTTVTVDRWREVLSPEEVFFVESKTGAWMERFGYESSNAPSLPVSDEIVAMFRERRTQMKRAAQRRALKDKTYPYPVVARLTTAQRRRHTLTSTLRRS